MGRDGGEKACKLSECIAASNRSSHISTNVTYAGLICTALALRCTVPEEKEEEPGSKAGRQNGLTRGQLTSFTRHLHSYSLPAKHNNAAYQAQLLSIKDIIKFDLLLLGIQVQGAGGRARAEAGWFAD